MIVSHKALKIVPSSMSSVLAASATSPGILISSPTSALFSLSTTLANDSSPPALLPLLELLLATIGTLSTLTLIFSLTPRQAPQISASNFTSVSHFRFRGCCIWWELYTTSTFFLHLTITETILVDMLAPSYCLYSFIRRLPQAMVPYTRKVEH